jgi:hypothetical protein
MKLSNCDIVYTKQLIPSGEALDTVDVMKQHYAQAGASTWWWYLAKAGLHGQVQRLKPFIGKMPCGFQGSQIC